jgi:hypothetical protein
LFVAIEQPMSIPKSSELSESGLFGLAFPSAIRENNPKEWR